MAKKKKKKVVKPITSKAVKKAKKAYDKLKKPNERARQAYKKQKTIYIAYLYDEKHAKTKQQKTYWHNVAKRQKPRAHAKYVHYRRIHGRFTRAKSKYHKLHSTRNQQRYTSSMTSKINAHNKRAGLNEGKAAIYPSKGTKAGKIIYISPSDTESSTTTSTITEYPVDKGAPRSNYARVSGRTITVGGILTGSKNGSDIGRSRKAAKSKLKQLKSWQNNHIMLTYKGDIYYKHLMISSLEEDYQSFKYDIKVSITFTFVYDAVIKKERNHKKTSKGSKTVRGNRSKRYTAITVKRGETLYRLSKKYGKSLKWLQKVNKIKNINQIQAGQRLYVRYKHQPKKIAHEYIMSTQNPHYKIRVR